MRLDELKQEFRLNKKKGIKVCLGVTVNGKPRVTVNETLVQIVADCVKRCLETDC